MSVHVNQNYRGTPMKSTTLLAITLCLSFQAFSESNPKNTLDEIKERGFIRCGVNTGLQGFSIQDKQGKWNGFDVEFCRALSSAIFETPDKVQYTGLSGKERFSALKYGQIDVLYRNSTMTASRDTGLDITFPGINYYDGQGFMIKKSKRVSSAYKLRNITFCMADGTSSLKNLNDFLTINNLNTQTKVLKLRTAQDIKTNLNNGTCDATSSDQSQLYSQRVFLNDPDEYLILPEVISKEPLGPAVQVGDNQWFSIVRWTLSAMIEAEFLDINSRNIANINNNEKNTASVDRLLGKTGDLGENLGLSKLWAYHIISQVGNYSEVFEKTIGSQSDLGIARGLNAQWNDGGILYSSPF